MKRKTSMAMGGKAIPFALSLLTANLLVANTALAQDDNKELEEIVITGSYISLMKRHLLMCLIAITFRSKALSQFYEN